MRTVQVFVFGTLRVNAGRWARAAEVADPVENCVVKGLMYNYGGFPYVNFDEDGLVYGDVLTFDADHPDYIRMCHVEIGAGYVEREVRVNTPQGGLIDCYAWDATDDTRTYILPRLRTVPSGDWYLASQERYRVH